MTTTEHRSLELRDFDGDTGEFEAVACVYNITDDHQTRWMPGCFTEALGDQLPEIRWGHRRDRRIGEAVDYRDNDTQLVIIGQLDAPEERAGKRLPFIQRAWQGLKSKVLEDFSLGALIHEFRVADDGRREFERAAMEELSVVLDGGVPGAKLLVFRESDTAALWTPEQGIEVLERVPVDVAMGLAERQAAGEITYEEAVAELRSGIAEPDAPSEPVVPPELAEADEMLAQIESV